MADTSDLVTNINQAFTTLKLDLTVEFGSIKKFTFHDKDGKELTAADISKVIEPALQNLTGAKKAWLQEFAGHIDMSEGRNGGKIGGSKANNEAFIQLAEKGTTLEHQKKVNFKLSAADLQTEKGQNNALDIAHALTNIADHEGIDISFSALKGYVVYAGDKDLAKQVIQRALAIHPQLADMDTMGSEGRLLVEKMTSKDHAILFDKKTTGRDPVFTVNLVENKNILVTHGNLTWQPENGVDMYVEKGAALKKNMGDLADKANKAMDGASNLLKNIGGKKDAKKEEPKKEAEKKIAVPESEIRIKLDETYVEDSPRSVPTSSGKGAIYGPGSGGKNTPRR